MRDRVIEITDKDQERDEAELRRVNPKAFQTWEEYKQEIIKKYPKTRKTYTWEELEPYSKAIRKSINKEEFIKKWGKKK